MSIRAMKSTTRHYHELVTGKLREYHPHVTYDCEILEIEVQAPTRVPS